MTERRAITVSTGSILKVIGVLLALGFLYMIRDVLALVFIAWLLSSAFFPAVDWIYRRLRIPRPLGLAVLYLTIGGLITVLVLLLAPVVNQQVQQLGEVVPRYVQQLGDWWESFTQSPSPLPPLENLGSINIFAGNVFSALFGVFSTFFSIILVIVLTFYFTAEESNLRRAVLAILPNRYAPYTSQLISRIQHRLGMWLRGQLILSLLVGSLVYIGLTLLGNPYALVLGLIMFVLEIVPFIGPVIAGTLAALLTLSLGYPLMMVLLVIGLYVLVQQLENNLITPRVLGSAVQLNPLLVIIAILIGATVAGVVGALLAVPVVAMVAEVAKDAWLKRADETAREDD